MAYFPFMIDLKDRKALVVGGGDVALSKIRKLRDFDADVSVVANNVLSEIKEIEGVKVIQKLFEEKDLNDNFFLVVAATDDKVINNKISLFCKERNILVNVVDDPESSSFVFPATLRRGNLTVAVSSGGVAPGAAAELKNSIDKQLPDNIDEIFDFVAEERAKLKRDAVELDLRKKIVRLLWDDAVAKGRPLTAEERSRVISDATKKRGRVSLVGAGAGDASLATVRAIEKIRKADVVLYDELIDKKLLDYAPKDAKRISVGTRGRAPSARQDDINGRSREEWSERRQIEGGRSLPLCANYRRSRGAASSRYPLRRRPRRLIAILHTARSGDPTYGSREESRRSYRDRSNRRRGERIV